jgi:uncharacterized protein
VKKRLLNDREGRVFIVIFDKGDEVKGGLERFARAEVIAAARFTGIGAFEDVTLAFFDRAKMEYDELRLGEQVEVLSFLGDIALGDEGPAVHAHVVVGLRDGTTRGGHLLEGRVWPTLEVVLDELPGVLHKRLDPETGLALIDPDLLDRDPRWA